MDAYYNPCDLSKFGEISKEAPALWEKFMGWYSSVFEPGALSKREKSLIALAVAHAVKCPYCIDAHTQSSLENGSSKAQMTEAIHVASAITGGATLVHSVQMRNAAEKVEF